jgi:hypothetical protein
MIILLSSCNHLMTMLQSSYDDHLTISLRTKIPVLIKQTKVTKILMVKYFHSQNEGKDGLKTVGEFQFCPLSQHLLTRKHSFAKRPDLCSRDISPTTFGRNCSLQT